MAENQEVTLTVEQRDSKGTRNVRRLRRQGLVPAVVYGHGADATPLSINARDLREVLDQSGLIKLQFKGGGEMQTILRDIQQQALHPDEILHVDFQEVRADEQVVATVPIEAFGEAAGVHTGGILNQLVHELDVKCLPAKIPETIEVDVSELEMEDTMTVAELPLGEDVEPQAEAEDIVFQVAPPKISEAAEEEEAGTEEEMAEPEVVSKGKKEEEEETGES